MRAMLDAFHVAATRIRNSLLPGVTLSPSLPTLRHQIKTVLFAQSYAWSFACARQFYFVVTRVFLSLCAVSLQSFDFTPPWSVSLWWWWSFWCHKQTWTTVTMLLCQKLAS